MNPDTYDGDPTLERLVRVVPFGLPAEPPRRSGAAPLRRPGLLGPDSCSAYVLSLQLLKQFCSICFLSGFFGALVVVFQQGHGSKLFGLHGPTGSVYPIVPILSFAIVFGLSMDYEVFLVARVLEERRRGLSERSAVIEGLARTAGLITSAASIMIAVFTAFTLGSFLVVQMLGFTLAVAVLIDATVVRMIVGPALLQLAGDWNWWPFGLSGAAVTSEKELVP